MPFLNLARGAAQSGFVLAECIFLATVGPGEIVQLRAFQGAGSDLIDYKPMFLRTGGPMIFVMQTGSFCQKATAASNLDLSSDAESTFRPFNEMNCHASAAGFDPHCALNLYVPSSGVERPKSK